MNSEEVWRRCVDPYIRYEVSNFGRIRNANTLQIMKTRIHDTGYECVSLRKKGRASVALVHRLVAFAFCEGYMKGMEVNHKDRNKLNNTAWNLEWIEHSKNMTYSRDNFLPLCKPVMLMKDNITPHGIYPSMNEVQRQYGGCPINHYNKGMKFKGFKIVRISVSMYKEIVNLLKQDYTLKSAWIEASTNLFIDRNLE